MVKPSLAYAKPIAQLIVVYYSRGFLHLPEYQIMSLKFLSLACCIQKLFSSQLERSWGVKTMSDHLGTISKIVHSQSAPVPRYKGPFPKPQRKPRGLTCCSISSLICGPQLCVVTYRPCIRLSYEMCQTWTIFKHCG